MHVSYIMDKKIKIPIIHIKLGKYLKHFKSQILIVLITLKSDLLTLLLTLRKDLYLGVFLHRLL